MGLKITVTIPEFSGAFGHRFKCVNILNLLSTVMLYI